MSKPTTGEILEKAIMDDPDDLAAHAAYADWLTQEGDPRGEFIQVQLALEDAGRPAKERKELQYRENKLLEKHGRKWLGGLADHLLDQKGYRLLFARGWLDYLGVGAIGGIRRGPRASGRVPATAPSGHCGGRVSRYGFRRI